ncbi:MAG: signal recognition particle-docking protein FtsY [Candidatus Babeliales bacterium]
MFSFIKNQLHKIYSQVTSKLTSLFSRSSIDAQTLKELEELLIQADTGVPTTRTILASLKKQVADGTIAKGTDLHQALRIQLNALLTNTKAVPINMTDKLVYLLVGINGSGKTTFASKLAYKYAHEGKRVLLVAADTFRAAATQQLATWAERTNTALVVGTPGQDPASVVFAGCERFMAAPFDVLIIDTAGRLQTKVNLMKELEKIKKNIVRLLPHASICTVLTIDAMLGQNSLEQARLFHESTNLDGIVLTKMDGTGKGGIVFAIVQELHIPIIYLSFGEQMEQCKLFNATEYVDELLGK